MRRWTNGLPGATARLGAMMTCRGLAVSQCRMRADTHPGPEHQCSTPEIAVGTRITPRPPHRSVRAQLRHTAPTLGGDGKAYVRPWVKDLGLQEKVIGQLCDPLPCEVVLLTAAPQRAQPEARDMVAKGAECREVSRHGVVGKVAPYDLRQSTPLFGDRLVHSPP
jgi:hypothetical protein